MTNVIMRDGFYQELRKKLLTLVSEEVTVTFGKNNLFGNLTEVFTKIMYQNLLLQKFIWRT